jgi:hypothetical protein
VEGRKSQTLKDLDTQQSVGLLIRGNRFTANGRKAVEHVLGFPQAKNSKT